MALRSRARRRGYTTARAVTLGETITITINVSSPTRLFSSVTGLQYGILALTLANLTVKGAYQIRSDPGMLFRSSSLVSCKSAASQAYCSGSFCTRRILASDDKPPPTTRKSASDTLDPAVQPLDGKATGPFGHCDGPTFPTTRRRGALRLCPRSVIRKEQCFGAIRRGRHVEIQNLQKSSRSSTSGAAVNCTERLESME